LSNIEVQQGCANLNLGDKNLYVHSLLTLIPPPHLMILSPKPTKQDWHPSSLLAYAAVPNSQDDIDSTTSEVKSTAEIGTDFYDYSLTSRNYALAGVACTSIISCSFIIAGVVIVATSRATNGAIQFRSRFRSAVPEVLGLVLSLITTLCTESTGLLHGISLRYALASESRLRFNTNLRLLTAARGWRNPNGSLLNGVMAVLLIISYTSASLVILSFDGILKISNSEWGKLRYVCISGPPLIVLGIALLLQVVISLSGMWAVKILTWSPSPFNLTAALVHHTQLTPVPFRCMRGMSESDIGGPAKPSETQSSPWHAHGSIRKVIHFLWGLVVACAGWAALIALISWPSESTTEVQSSSPQLVPIPPSPPQPLWSFLPEDYHKLVSWTFPLSGDVTVQWWILSIVILALVQGLLTLGLHCSELIVNVIGDERCWRRATSRKGLRMTNNPLMQFFSNPFGLVLFVAKPVLRESFALASDCRH
jgi:hypothetical protein